MPDDLYATLGVAPTATTEEIETAYRRLARQYHPDVNRTPEAADRMRAINGAYRVLRDPDRRADYDRDRLQSQAVAGRSAEWQDFARWEAARATARPSAPSSAPRGVPVSMPLVVGAVLLLLLTGFALVWLTGRGGGESGPGDGVAASAPRPTVPRPPSPSPVAQPTATRPNVVLAAAPPAATATATATRSPATATRSSSPTATITDTPTPTATATATATPPRQAPPLVLTASEFYNEQETRAGGRKFQIKLNIRNESNQTLNPPWRPRFLVYAGDRQKGWVDASYYGAAFGGVDIARQPPIRPGEQQTWSWYVITAGPDEWVRQIEFSGLGTRWTWTFDRPFQNAQLTIGR